MSGPTVHGSRLPHSDPSAVDGPPPGFDVDDAHPVAPEVPPEPTFGKNTARPCVGRGDNDGSSSSQQGQSAPDSTQREWSDHGYGQWDVHREQPWGNSWETGDKRAEWTDWNRRSSWDTAASTTIDGGDTSVRKQRGNQDPWRDGNDPWSGNKTRAEWKERGDWQDHRQEDGRQDPWRDPWADGRADQERERDYPDRQQAAWSNGGAKQGTAWNGWSFFDNGGFKAQGGNQALVPGGGRASEKLAVPSFSGEDGEDVGGSARSYLRQVEAWRRMTLLPATQQGLVLYQNLTGKAWIAAEELSVDRLASSDGVEYFVQWLNARFLDLEVARIGRAFSEFFRKLRRKPSQSIREYNTEYDRLHARLREVGCSLPQECAAWLYVDRLQLDEPQELNLLASVGNQYHLGKLQQAAVLHDRGHRKPWEARGRKPHTAHLTEAGDDGPGADEDEELEDFDGDGIPEEVAIAYATYQSAKDKYKEQSRARGYQGDRAAGGGRDRGGQMPSSSREEKVKLMKAKSYCMSCGKKGHWHKDPECPNRGGPKEVDMCHHVPAEVYALKHEGKTLLGITDTACAKSVAGTVWLQQYTEHTEQFQGKPQLVRESEAFKFGTGRIHHSAFHVLVRFKLGDKVVEMKTSIINGDIPLLLSKSALAQLGMVYDLAQNSADFTKVGLREFPLVTTSSGHPAIPIAPARCDDDCAKLVIQDGGVSESRVYMAFAVSEVGFPQAPEARPTRPHTTTTTSAAPTPQVLHSPDNATNRETTASTTMPTTTSTQARAQPVWGSQYKIFYDKKLSPEVRELLTQDRLHEVSFIAWWKRTKITTDFWLESEFAWHRIHVTPRRALCNPRAWKTQSIIQKDMLLRSIGDVRVTEGFCCRTEKPIEAVVDRWGEGDADRAFETLWIGRSTFAKLSNSCPSQSPLATTGGHGRAMQTPGNQQDEQGAVVERSQPPRVGGAQDVVLRGVESGDPGAQDERCDLERWTPDAIRDQLDPAGVEGQGHRARRAVPLEHHKGQPSPPGEGPRRDPSQRAHEDREVQGLGVSGDPQGVWDVGGPRGEDEWQSPRGTGALREVVGGGPVPEALRPPRALHREERGGPLQRGPTLGDIEPAIRGLGMDERVEDDIIAGQARRLPDPTEDNEARSFEFRIRGTDGRGDRQGHSRGDPEAGGTPRGVEGQGEGRKHSDQEVREGCASSSVGYLAPADEKELCEKRDRGHHGDLGLELRRPPRGCDPPKPKYEHDGNQFGSKTVEHPKGCCGKDEDAATNDVFLSEYDLERAKDNKYYNYECTHRPGDARDVFVEAIAKCDYSNATLLRLLNSTQLQQVKTQRDDVFGAKHAKVTYHTYGLYTHGGVLGVTNKTRENSGMVRYLNEFARRRLGEHAKWSSITVARDAKTEVHHDYNNLRGSKNYTFSIGQEAGGEVWVEDRGVSEDNIDADVKWRRIGSGQWVPGKNHNTNGRFYEFDPFLKHGTEPWRGSRWCLTYHTTRGIIKAKRHTKDFLRNCGFPLPRGGIGAEEGVSQPDRRPRRSIRKEIYNNAAKISVMLASLVCAAGSYMSDHVFPEVIKSPLVMFEIGGTEATEEAANLDKDVMEPMSWEDYRTPEGKEAAHHIVNGGYPRELRVHLRGKGDQPNDALTELVGNQLHSGGAVVIDGSVKDTLLIHDGFVAIRENFQQHWSGDDEDFFLVLFKNKDDNIGLQCHDRVHQVCAVTCEGQQRGSSDGPVMGAGGITFGEGTPNTIATALRRLHQNLGHPRGEDLLRHLRLAGCDTTVLKAARSMRCQVCDACAGPKVARPSTIPSMCDWNDTLGVDIFYAHDINDEKHAFLSVVDFGTTYHLAAKVDGTSADILERKFNELWILPFGPPKTIVLDLEGGPQVALGRLCDWHNITVRSVATQSHWQAGMVERQQAWWKSVWDRVIYQKSIAADEVDITAPIINGAKNELRRRCGYSPSQWVFGKAPRVAEELRDPDNGEKFVWDATEDSKFQRQAAIRASARVAFHQSQTDSRLRKALLQRTRVASRPFEVGESVHFWFKPKNRRRGEWAGPAVIVGKEGGNFWLSKSGRCRLTSPEHMRPTTPEEVGELLSMKGTQKEVEKLLDFDPDDQEVFEEPEDMDLDLEEYAPTDYEPEDDTEMPVLDPYEEIAEKILPAPTRRLKRKTAPADSEHAEHEALMLRSDLTRRGVEKRKEKELKWSEIPEEVHQKFRDAEKTQWDEHLAYDALQPLSLADSDRIRATVPAERILRCRWAYKDKNYARRREGEEVPWKCKSRLVIAGHTDPDLGTEQLTTDAPTLSRSGLSCMLQIVANGRSAPDPWTVAAGDIRCAFLTGSYLTRELYMHQPRTGFPGMHPGELVKIKKNVFGLATSPHEWWNDLRGGIFSIEIDIPHTGPEVKYKFEQCALDPCVFTLRKWKDGVFCEEPIAYIGCHVDDILIGAPQSLQKAMQKALSGTFPIDEWEENEFEFLGSKIRVSDYEVELSQEKYATTRLFQLDLPLNAKDEELASPELVSDNRSLIGALSWMSSTSRPDLTCSVSMAQQLQKSPTHGDIKFTNQTAHKAIQFKQRGLKYKSIPPDRMMIVIYHDAAWANVPEADPDEDYYVLTHEDNLAGLQREGPYALTGVDRKAKKGNSKVASQLGILVTFMDRGALSGEAGDFSIADWRSQAGQRVCRSTFGAETQACAEGLETGQYIRSMYESMLAGKLVSVEAARMPILCLSDCRSLYDHLNKQGVPRVPTDKRLAVDLAALRQGLRSEMWSDELPIGWLPGSAQRADVLTKPQNPTDWWETADQKVLLPLALGQRGGLVCDRQTTQRTSVKLEGTSGIRVGSLFPFEYERIGSHQG